MLKQLEIENLKCIKKASLQLAPLTIITGANSSGKSTAFQALMLAIKESNEINSMRMDTLLAHLNDFAQIRNRYTNPSEISIAVRNDKDNTTELTLNRDESVLSGSLNYYYEAKERESSQKELFYLSANRIAVEDIVSVSLHQKVGAQGQFLFSHFHKIKNNQVADYLLKPDSSAQDLAYQLTLWLNDITGAEIELKTELLGDKVKVFYHDKVLKIDISPFNLGAGISYLAKVLIVCLMAKKGDLVIIENPEIHLHPKSQALLGKFFTFIANAGIQLIIETHSEHLINKIRFLVYEKDFANDDVAIHYKENTLMDFQSLFLDINGRYINEQKHRVAFPSGFFDSTLHDLIKIGG